MKFDLSAIARLAAAPVLALAIGAAALPARAADILGGGGSYPDAGPAAFGASDVPANYGTGWYIRGDLSAGTGSITQVGGDGSGTFSGQNLGGDVGFGYQYGNYLRVDWDFGGVPSKSSSFVGGPASTVICPYTLQSLSSQTQKNVSGNPLAIGYLWSATAGSCTPKGGSSFGRLHTLLNAYADLGDWWGVTPYVGAGAGIARLQGTYWQNYYKTSDGSVYATDLTASSTGGFPLLWNNGTCDACYVNPTIPGTTTIVPFGPQNWYTASKFTKYTFAWNVMAGVTYDFSRNAKLDVGVRYLNLGTVPVPPSAAHPTGGQVTVDDKQVRVGFRYLID